MSQCVVFEIVTYAMIECIFELPLHNYAISILISLGQKNIIVSGQIKILN